MELDSSSEEEITSTSPCHPTPAPSSSRVLTFPTPYMLTCPYLYDAVFEEVDDSPSPPEGIDDSDMSTFKTTCVPSWYQQTFEKRPMKKRDEKNKTTIPPPDVYPQDHKQEEDNLGHERLKKGYLVAVTHFEHESMVHGHHRNPFAEKLDDFNFKAAVLYMQVMNKKGEINANFDRGKRKDAGIAAIPTATTQKAIQRCQFFADLSRGKSLSNLIKKPPAFKRRNDILEYLYDFKVCSSRALWFLKLRAVMHHSSGPNRKKTFNCDAYAVDYAITFSKVMRDLFSRMNNYTKITDNQELNDRWTYFNKLSRAAFDEGVVDRQECINELLDIFTELFIKHKEQKPLPLNYWLAYFHFFLGSTLQNLILTRRLAHMMCVKIALMKEEFEAAHGITENALEQMSKCDVRKHYLNSMVGYLYATVLDQPGALVYNKYFVNIKRRPQMLAQLGGSPLDHLPCFLSELPFSCGPDTDDFKNMVAAREIVIVHRSERAQEKWSKNYPHERAYALLIEGCLDTIGILDSHDILTPDAFQIMAESLFNFKHSRYASEIVVRVKLMLHWAVTVQREGIHRGFVVCRILNHYIHRMQKEEEKYMFGGFHIQFIILDYMRTELPKPGQPNYAEEFGSFVVLFTELCRFNLFSHDWFLKDIIKSGEMELEMPIMGKYKHLLEEKKNGMQKEPQFEDLTPDEPLPAIAFIVTPQPPEEKRRLIFEEMTLTERILIQLPLRQIEKHKSEVNQRALLLYGHRGLRKEFMNQLRSVAQDICRLWKKKIYVKFFKKTDDVQNAKRITPSSLAPILEKFTVHTYYDQMVIAGWCAEHYTKMFQDFTSNKSLQLPTQEGLDILLSLFTQCNYPRGIFEVAMTILPLLPRIEKIIRSLASDCMPGFYSGQICYVLAAYMSKHLHYFINTEQATTILHLMYFAIQKPIQAVDHAMNGFTRSAAAFYFMARNVLMRANADRVALPGPNEEFKKVFFQGNEAASGQSPEYNSTFFMDIFNQLGQINIRFYSYHAFKKRLPSFQLAKNRYSFVVNAFITAKNCGRDYDRLTDLANFCAHFTAQIPILGEEWLGAFRALCGSPSQPLGYTDLLQNVNVKDCSTHYALATFAVLLATKYAYSIPKMICELLNSCFPTVMKKESVRNARSSSHSHRNYDCESYEPGVCLALLYLAHMSCQTDQPFIMSDHYTGGLTHKKLLKTNADENFLSIIHWCELENVLFPMLANIGILNDALHTRVKESDFQLPRISENSDYRREYLPLIVRQVLSSISEQDWVTDRMFKIAESNKMESFNQDRLKQNCLGQQLLRLGTRRKCERQTLKELFVCNGNSKKALIDKLLSVLSIWNIRATVYDLRLMIKEISPDGSQKHAQQSAIAADALMGEIGKCCRDLFTQAYNKQQTLRSPTSSTFRFDMINNHWLIASLVRILPQPQNCPSSFQNMSVRAKALKEAGLVLDLYFSKKAKNNQENLVPKTPQDIKFGAWLLVQQPFINLIQSCMQPGKHDRDIQQSRDDFVKSLVRQIQDMAKVKESSTTDKQMKKLERGGIILRLKLLATIITDECMSSCAEPVAIVLFQLLIHGVITPYKNKDHYHMVFDMLSNVIIWTLTEDQKASIVEREVGEQRYKFPNFNQIIKKLRKELLDIRIPFDLKAVHAFLPLPKNNFEMINFELYGTQGPNEPKRSAKYLATHTLGQRRGRLALQLKKSTEKLKVTTFDIIQGLNPDTMRKFPTLSFFQAVRLDNVANPIQKWVARLLTHRHHKEFHRTNIGCIMDSATSDVFLSAPQMEATGEPPDKKDDKEKRSPATPNSAAGTPSVSSPKDGSPKKKVDASPKTSLLAASMQKAKDSPKKDSKVNTPAADDKEDIVVIEPSPAKPKEDLITPSKTKEVIAETPSSTASSIKNEENLSVPPKLDPQGETPSPKKKAAAAKAAQLQQAAGIGAPPVLTAAGEKAPGRAAGGGRRRSSQGQQPKAPAQPRKRNSQTNTIAGQAAAAASAAAREMQTQAQQPYNPASSFGGPQNTTSNMSMNWQAPGTSAAPPHQQPAPNAVSMASSSETDSKMKLHNLVTKRLEDRQSTQQQQQNAAAQAAAAAQAQAQATHNFLSSTTGHASEFLLPNPPPSGQAAPTGMNDGPPRLQPEISHPAQRPPSQRELGQPPQQAQAFQQQSGKYSTSAQQQAAAAAARHSQTNAALVNHVTQNQQRAAAQQQAQQARDMGGQPPMQQMHQEQSAQQVQQSFPQSHQMAQRDGSQMQSMPTQMQQPPQLTQQPSYGQSRPGPPEHGGAQQMQQSTQSYNTSSYQAQPGYTAPQQQMQQQPAQQPMRQPMDASQMMSGKQQPGQPPQLQQQPPQMAQRHMPQQAQAVPSQQPPYQQQQVSNPQQSHTLPQQHPQAHAAGMSGSYQGQTDHMAASRGYQAPEPASSRPYQPPQEHTNRTYQSQPEQMNRGGYQQQSDATRQYQSQPIQQDARGYQQPQQAGYQAQDPQARAYSQQPQQEAMASRGYAPQQPQPPPPAQQGGYQPDQRSATAYHAQQEAARQQTYQQDPQRGYQQAQQMQQDQSRSYQGQEMAGQQPPQQSQMAQQYQMSGQQQQQPSRQQMMMGQRIPSGQQQQPQQMPQQQQQQSMAPLPDLGPTQSTGYSAMDRKRPAPPMHMQQMQSQQGMYQEGPPAKQLHTMPGQQPAQYGTQPTQQVHQQNRLSGGPDQMTSTTSQYSHYQSQMSAQQPSQQQQPNASRMPPGYQMQQQRTAYQKDDTLDFPDLAPSQNMGAQNPQRGMGAMGGHQMASTMGGQGMQMHPARTMQQGMGQQMGQPAPMMSGNMGMAGGGQMAMNEQVGVGGAPAASGMMQQRRTMNPPPEMNRPAMMDQTGMAMHHQQRTTQAAHMQPGAYMGQQMQHPQEQMMGGHPQQQPQYGRQMPPQYNQQQQY